MTVTSNISTTTTWTSNHTYFIKNSIAVNSGVTLSIASGTVVKVNSSTFLSNNGTLSAIGDPANLIYFTSANDNSVGSTTASSTGNPSPGDWDYFAQNSGASTTITNAIIRYAGSLSAGDVYVTGGTSTFTNVTFATSSNQGLYVSGGTVTVSSSTFSNSKYGLFENSTSNVTLSSSTFSGNTSDAVYLSVYNGATLTASGDTSTVVSGAGGGITIVGTLSANETLYHDLPYYITPAAGNLIVASGTTLTVKPGAVVKASSTVLEILANGTLDAEGTAGNPIYFTSIGDNTVDPGTNGTTTTTAKPGDWICIASFSGASTTITNAVISYGGGVCQADSTNELADVGINGGAATLTSDTFASSSNYGVHVSGGMVTITSSTFSNEKYGLYETGAGNVTLATNTFSGNTSNAGYLDVTSGAILVPSGDTATVASGTGGGFTLYGTMGGNETLVPDLPYVIKSTVGSLTVASGTKLTANSGTIVKLSSGTILVNAHGTLDVEGASSSPVYFTSLKDNKVAPGTNGTTTSNPAAGDWYCIGANSGASTTINYAVIRYGGNASSNCITGVADTEVGIGGGTSTIYYTDVSYSGHYGIRASSGTVSISTDQIHNNLVGVDVDGGNVTVASSTFFANSGYGAFQGSGPTSTMTNNYWGGWMAVDLSTATTTYNSGPLNALTNPQGLGDQVSSYIGYSPYIAAYISNPAASTWAPPGVHPDVQPYGERVGSSTTYQTELDAGINVWNASSSGYVTVTDASSSPSSTWDIYVEDVSNTNVGWAGAWIPSTTSTPHIMFNTAQMDSQTTTTQQRVAEHELGHSFGLAHNSTSGPNIMCSNDVPGTCIGPTTLASQDLSDFSLLWSPNYLFDPFAIKGIIKW